MHRMGISIYPEHSTEKKDYDYMKLAAKYGFTRIFTCLLSVDQTKEIIMNKFTKFMEQAHELGFIVGVDTNPSVFLHLGATPYDLKPFYDMKVDIVRLDGHFSDREDIAITHNSYGIPIEFNGSSNTALDLMIERGANSDNMVVCHNFYPQKYTGLGWNKFARRYGVKKIKYQVKNPRGIHARPAGLLVNEFSKFKSNVIIEKVGKAVNAKEMFPLMSLSIKQGDNIVITFEGEEEIAEAKAAEKYLKENL